MYIETDNSTTVMDSYNVFSGQVVGSAATLGQLKVHLIFQCSERNLYSEDFTDQQSKMDLISACSSEMRLHTIEFLELCSFKTDNFRVPKLNC